MTKIIPLFFILSIFFIIGCNQTSDKSDQPTKDVSLSMIEATPLKGAAPLDVSFVVQLLNIEGHEEDYYCAAMTWDFGDGEREAITPGCLPYEEVKDQDDIVQLFYTTQHFYRSPGTYTVRFTLNDLVSAPVTITVYGGSETSCKTDSDCVPAQCCHPTSVINKQYAPNCSAVLCDASCQGPLDCGTGKPVCMKGTCVIQPSS